MMKPVGSDVHKLCDVWGGRGGGGVAGEAAGGGAGVCICRCMVLPAELLN